MNKRRAQPSYPPLIWAANIAVVDGPGGLAVIGKPAVLAEETQRSAFDVWHQYLHPTRGLEPTHMMFANAKQGDALRKFVERFGPVVAESYGEGDDTIVATQSWSDLKTEQAVYHAAWELREAFWSSSPQRLRDLVKIILDGVTKWPEQHAREVLLRANQGMGVPGWRFDDNNLTWLRGKVAELTALCGSPKGDKLLQFMKAPHKASEVAQLVLSELVNAYPVKLSLWGSVVAELPASDMLFGVRPALYAMLRREFISDTGVRFCKDETCGRLFTVTHGRQQYCPDRDCEQHHRQRKYWALKGSAKRRQRVARSRKPHSRSPKNR